ncbi:MAG: thiamine pyrophosphate-binding protein, partial [Sphingomonadales bacterium]
MAEQLYTGGVAVVDALIAHGVSHAFCVPGESYLPVLDALYDVKDKINLITCRHESGAANMADAHGKLTGKPGICLVTRGPGASNAAIGVHTAMQDSTPMILLVGQVASHQLGREAFQEVEYREMFKPLAKWVVQIENPGDIATVMTKAFHIATSGRMGPVVVALPEDILSSVCERQDIKPLAPDQASPTADDLAALGSLLGQAERPLVILGGSGWTRGAVKDFRAFAGREGLAVGCAFRFQDLLDPRSDNYVGDIGIGINPKLAAMVRDADVILALGPRLGEMTTSGYTLIKPPKPEQTLVHIHAGKEELGKVYQADLGIHSTPANFVSALMGLKLGRKKDWAGWLVSARKNYLDWSTPNTNPGPVQLAELYRYLRETLPDDAILTNGAGNYTAWLHRFYHYRGFNTQVAPTSGAMGYGVPAAIGAKITEPDRVVVSISGDGCFLMTGQELATAALYKVPVIFLVFNNAMYGTIRMHQERDYPGRVSGTGLKNPDFVGYAKSFGIAGWLATTNDEFEAAFDAAL